MSRRFSLHILLPIEGYEEDKIYESEDISLVKNIRWEKYITFLCIRIILATVR